MRVTIPVLSTLLLTLTGCHDKVLVTCECPPAAKDCQPSAAVLYVGNDRFECPPGATLRAQPIGTSATAKADGGAR